MFALFIEEWAPNGPPQWAVGPKKKAQSLSWAQEPGPKPSPFVGWAGLGFGLCGLCGSLKVARKISFLILKTILKRSL